MDHWASCWLWFHHLSFSSHEVLLFFGRYLAVSFSAAEVLSAEMDLRVECDLRILVFFEERRLALLVFLAISMLFRALKMEGLLLPVLSSGMAAVGTWFAMTT